MKRWSHLSSNLIILVGVACVSLAVLLLEITLTRVFSVMMWYHFAFLAISLALLGGAVGGVTVYALRPRLMRWRPEVVLAVLATLFGISVPLAFAACLHIPFRPSQGWLRLSPQGTLGLVVIYLDVAIPFFFGGLCMALALAAWSERAGSLYFADLVGAGLGCVAAVVALDRLGGSGAVLLAGLVAALASIAFALAARRRALVAAILLITILGTGLTLRGVRDGWFYIESLKPDDRDFETTRRWERWNSFSRVTVHHHETGGPPFGWGLSDRYQGPNPGYRLITIDAAAGSPIQYWDRQPGSVDFLKYDVTALVHYLRSDARVLIIGLGGGRDALTALVFSQRDITGVEINPLIYQAVKYDFADFAGYLLDLPVVHAIVGDGRNYVARTPERFDIIQAALADTWAASSAGAFALTENSLYTLEAFQDYFRHLTDDGILTFSRWYVPQAPGETLRLVGLGLAAWQRMGVDHPERNLMVVANVKSDWAEREPLATMLLKRSTFTAEEIATMQKVAADLGFEVLYAPGMAEGNEIVRLAVASSLEEFWRDYAVDISPPSDDRPFFFYLFKIGSLLQRGVRAQDNVYRMSFQGMYILVALLVLISALAVVLILLPLRLLVRRGNRRADRPCRVVYFACLGLAFMLIELPSIQRLTLFLGQPIYALAVVLFSLLLFSGLGSLVISRVAPSDIGRVLRWVLPLLVILLLIQALAIPWLLKPLLQLRLALRLIVSVALVAPMGFLMGMPFPLGLRSLGIAEPDIVPWVWGVNGALSVLGSVLAIFVAIHLGFRVTLTLGAALYLLAWVLARRWQGLTTRAT
jgi:SAM-dependent methyltransferase